VPTLVAVRAGWQGYERSRSLAEHINGARYVELPGEDYLFFVGDTAPLLDAVEEFVTGRLPRHDVDRVLATVLFTDVVSSTDQVAGMGDRRWSELLATHDGVTRAELERFRGREIQTTGDGFLATFDGPGRAVRCACAIRDAVRAIGIRVRCGLHTGEIELHADDIGGSPSTSPNGSKHSPSPTKSSSRARSSTSSAARASRSLIAAPMRSRASPTDGNSSPSKTHWDPTPRATSSPNPATNTHRTAIRMSQLSTAAAHISAHMRSWCSPHLLPVLARVA
jgi:hypothetical protein